MSASRFRKARILPFLNDFVGLAIRGRRPDRRRRPIVGVGCDSSDSNYAVRFGQSNQSLQKRRDRPAHADTLAAWSTMRN
ncbi:MAG: hypothetical protein MZU97_21540 [Bacillus subtilis]|nr:hypothetical protein [Bacillus subtilis]